MTTPASYDSLKRFIEEQAVDIKKGLILDEESKKEICEEYSLSDPELKKLIKSLNAHLAKKYKGTFLTRQSMVETIKQVMAIESEDSGNRREQLNNIGELLLVFNHGTLPNLNGDIVEPTMSDDEEENSVDENININSGMLALKKEEIIRMASELPESDQFEITDDLSQRYEKARTQLNESIHKLQYARERLEAYRRVRQGVEFVEDDGWKASFDAKGISELKSAAQDVVVTPELKHSIQQGLNDVLS